MTVPPAWATANAIFVHADVCPAPAMMPSACIADLP